MGYYEVPCALCEVSFNIGRMRTIHEPRSAAWKNTLGPLGTNDAPQVDETCLQRHCRVAKRPSYRSHGPRGPTVDFEPQDEEFESTLPSGFDSEGNAINLEVYVASHKPEDRERTRNDLYLEDNLDDYLSWVDSKSISGHPPFKEGDEPRVPFYYEHVAGPDCNGTTEADAYNGNRITFEEMKACTTTQCLVPKQRIYEANADLPEWEPLRDDEDFERTSDYHLSGLGDRPGEVLEIPATPCYPVRHGVHEPNPALQADYLLRDGQDNFAMGFLPFHPYCLEVFKRVSLLHQGHIDINGLAERFARGTLYDGKRQETMKLDGYPDDDWTCSWEHRDGDEFMVANPVHIPVLRDVLARAKRPEPTFDVRDSPFQIDSKIAQNVHDIFGKLPEELRDMITGLLGSRDIANLRLASRSFHQLPNSLWHKLITKEMPWLWEAWCDRPYSRWACTTMNELKAYERACRKRRKASLALTDERESKKQVNRLNRERKKARQPQAAQQLGRLDTDWYWLYCEIRRRWSDMKGLQNRERIWYLNEHNMHRTAESAEALERIYTRIKERHQQQRA